MKDYSKYITVNSEKRFGQACVREMRITVYDVLNWLANGMTKENIISDYPELTVEDINACLSFAADREHNIRVVS